MRTFNSCIYFMQSSRLCWGTTGLCSAHEAHPRIIETLLSPAMYMGFVDAGTDDAVESLEQAEEFVEEFGLPVILKVRVRPLSSSSALFQALIDGTLEVKRKQL